MPKRVLFIILDGLAESGKSPLQLAEKPNLDFLTEKGSCGEIDNEVEGLDFSESAVFHLLGYKEFPGRGYVEALGAGLEPKENDICFRCNFATVDPVGRVLDRRAGRDETGLDELAKELNKIKIKDCKIIFKKSTGHRAILILRGEHISEQISATDPYETGKKIEISKPIIPEHHNDFPNAMRTAKILNQFTEEARKILLAHPINKTRTIPANAVLARCPGKKEIVKSFERLHGLKAACIAGVGSTIGLGKLLGMDSFKIGNALTTTDLKAKLSNVLRALQSYDFVLLHVKGCDVASHDKNTTEKIRFIQRIDSELISPLTALKDVLVVITADHRTSSVSGNHERGTVPVLIYNSRFPADRVESFDEESVAIGSLGIIQASDLMEKILDLM